MKKKKKESVVEQLLDNTNSEIICDPFGSYTGVPVDTTDMKPIQDADDL